jgi:hypothetical protein
MALHASAAMMLPVVAVILGIEAAVLVPVEIHDSFSKLVIVLHFTVVVLQPLQYNSNKAQQFSACVFSLASCADTVRTVCSALQVQHAALTIPSFDFSFV